MAKSENPAEPGSDTSQTQDSTSIVRRLVEIVVENNLAELEYEANGVSINIVGAVAPTVAASVPVPTQYVVPAVPASAPQATQALTAPAANSRAGLIPLEAPMMGTFYRAPSPNDPPFVNVGDTVRIGQTVCQIEAMKVFSDVPADVSGKVVEIVLDNGKLVHAGDPIMYLEPL